jgi:UPF0176 protein
MYTIAAFYRFQPLADPQALVDLIKDRFGPLGLFGSLHIATEGVNGTMSGSAETIAGLIDVLVERAGLIRTQVKYATAATNPFDRLKVRVREEIITFKQPGIDPATRTGTYVEAQDWNDLIAQDDVLLIDARNAYETEIGIFAGAVDPAIAHFSHFPDYVRSQLDKARHKRVAMYCTGGIRCEKAAAFMLNEGFEEVYHLKGGILKYLEEMPADRSSWQGKCFVFDERGAVGHEDFATDE